MTLTAGTRLGPYEILSPLGAGGMGEVYKARDSKLKRDVAIKVLPSALSKDPDALARFEREAHSVAALSHPNILAIHDFGEHEGIAYAVMELLQGETLRELLEGGALPTRRTVELSRQICAGLAAAHAAGLVHRDLKPDNIFVTADGRVKILDFGLAKPVVDDRAPDRTNSPTVSAYTEPGTVMGTVGYMSPEQVKALPVDHRSDIFSFGAVLYEMLTGMRAFQRETAAETMTAILREDPPEPPPGVKGVPAAFDRIVRHCLEKKPDQRFQSASDVAFALDTSEPATAVAVSAADRSGRRPFGWTAVLAGAAIGAAAVALVAFLGRSRPRSGPVVSRVARFGHDPGISEWPTWSPDGSLLAFASNRSGNFEIYVRRADGGQEVNVTNDPSEDFQPSFSPNGKSIAFVSTRSSKTGLVRAGAATGFQFRSMGGDLWVAPALGGQARRLAADANAPAWDPSGTSIVYVSGSEFHRSILRVPLEGGPPGTVLDGAKSSWEIVRLHFSPSGKWVSFETAPDGEVFLVPAAGGTPRSFVPNAMSHAWDARNDRILYMQQEPTGGTRLESVSVDERGDPKSSKPRTLAVMTGILGDAAIRSDGRQIAVDELEGSLNLTRLPLRADGGGPSGPEVPLSTGHVLDRYPAVSPDGRRIAYGSDRLGSRDLWIDDLSTGRSERIDLPGKPTPVNDPRWLPDGRRIVINRLNESGGISLWLVALDGSQAERLTDLPGVFASTSSGTASPDGTELLVLRKVGEWNQLFAFRIADRTFRQITSSPSDKSDATWSPDGGWVALAETAGGKYMISRVPAAGGAPTMLTSSAERLRHLFISKDPNWVYFQPSHRNIWRVPAGGGATQQVTHFPESGLFIEEPTIAPDGSYLAYCKSNGGASLWLLSLDDPEAR